MRVSAILSIIFVFFSTAWKSQSDSVPYRAGSVIEDAVFITYNDFRRYNGITREQIISGVDKHQLDFISKVLSSSTMEFKRGQTRTTVATDSLYGYVQNNTFYINYKGNFYRVPVFGAISYFVAKEIVINTFYDPRFGYPAVNAKSTEIREFIMDFYDGQVTGLTANRAEELLSRDEQLYSEFKKLKKRKQMDDLYRYIRRYNELHPVYFLK